MTSKARLAASPVAMAALLSVALIAILPAPGFAARFVLRNTDGPQEGLNDPTPVSPVTGNPGRTLGAQRRNVVEAVFWNLGRTISSSQEIIVEIAFDSLSCGALSGTLASAGPRRIVRDFDGAHRKGVWYASALAEAMAGEELVDGKVAIGVTFNGDVGTLGCLSTRQWDYGIGVRNTGGFLMFQVFSHELVHGLNFTTFMDNENGQLFLGFPDVYSLFVEDHQTRKTLNQMTNSERVAAVTGDLDWVGGNAATLATRLLAGKRDDSHHPRLFSPDELDGGSSVAHWDTSLSHNVDDYMEPFTTRSSSDVLTLTLLQDMGWPVNRGGAGWVDDLNGNGSIELAVLTVSDDPPGHRVAILDSRTKRLVRLIPLPTNRSAVGLAVVPHFAGGPGREIAVLTWRLGGNQVRAYVYDSSTGEQIRVIRFPSSFPLRFEAIPDYSGTAAGELALLATRQGTGARLWVLDAKSGATQRTLSFPNQFRPVDSAVVANFASGPAPEIAVAGEARSTGRALIKVRDGRNGALLNEIPLPTDAAHQFLRALPDFAGGPADELALLSLASDSGVPELRVFDAATGELLSFRQFADDFVPVGLEVLPNFTGSPADELVVWTRRGSDLRPRAEIVDGGTLAGLASPSLALKNAPVAVATLPDIGGTNARDMVVITSSARDRRMRAFLIDGRGNHIRNMIVP